MALVARSHIRWRRHAADVQKKSLWPRLGSCVDEREVTRVCSDPLRVSRISSGGGGGGMEEIVKLRRRVEGQEHARKSFTTASRACRQPRIAAGRG